MSGNYEFVIDEKKGDVVHEYLPRILQLFDVEASFTNGAGGMLWVRLNGPDERRAKAKDYITALTSPEQNSIVSIPASLVTRLGSQSDQHFELEAEYGVVITYPQETQAHIVGKAIDVTLATSKLEDLVKLAKAVQPKPAQTKLPQVKAPQAIKANGALQDFALKLGYEQAEITAVFEKLGPSIDKNTFLNELINCSKERSRPSRTVEDRRSPVPFHNGSPVRVNGYPRDTFPRHASEMAAPKGLPASSMNHGVLSRGMRLPEQQSGVISRGYRLPENQDPVPRGAVRTTAQTSQAIGPSPMYSNTMLNRDYNIAHQNNALYLTQGNDYGQIASDPRQEEQIFQELLSNRYQQFPQSDLRHIVIDGSNVAMSHGNNKVFSCKGIALCVEYFLQRGHTQITVFVPQWRKESAKPESPITDQHLLNQLEAQGYLTFTPSRRIKGRRIVCYDDRFIVRLAESTDGIIVSNDNFKDLAQENPKWRMVTERRLLMFSFVNDMFMPPDDPLGRHGPRLDEFLHKNTSTHRRVCPYGRRCTYGARCKYHHPEREDKERDERARLLIYQNLKDLFPSQDALILSVMKKYPQEKDVGTLASRILDLNT